MQHKHLFVALLCGALCLTGCLKNEESLSVQEVRNAKANELNAQAELLKAQANAGTVLANAQAELLKAQAEVEKAQATKIKAEADLLRVQADLAGIEVELAKVNVKIREEELKMKQLELQAMEAQLKVLIAACEAQLAEIAAELENMQLELEAEKYVQMLALLEAEEAYNAYLEGLDEAAQEEFQAAIAMYFHLQSAILEAQIQINENQIEIAQLEAAEDASYEAILEYYEEKLAELARIEVLIEKAEEYLTYDREDLDDILAQLNAELIDAYNDEEAARQQYADAREEMIELGQAFMGDGWNPTNAYPWPDPAGEFKFRYSEYALDYTMWDYENYPGGYQWEDKLMYHDAYWKSHEDEETGALIWDLGYDKDGEFVTLFTDQWRSGNPVYYEEGAAEQEKDDEAKGIYGAYTYAWQYTVVPAKTNIEAVTAFIDGFVDEEKESVAEEKEEAEALSKVVEALYKANVALFETEIEQMQAYMDAVQPKFDEAQEAVDEADLEKNLAAVVKELAQLAVYYGSIDCHELEEAVAAYNDAITATMDANLAYAAARQDSLDALADLKAEEQLFMLAYSPASTVKEAEFNRDNAIALATKDLNDKTAALTTADVTAFNNAKKATENAEAALEAAKATEEAKHDAYNAAVIAYNTNPTTATETAKNNAETAWNTAKTAVTTAETNLATAKTHYDGHNGGDVEQAYNAKVEAIENAQAYLNALNAKKLEFDTALELEQSNYEEKDLAAQDARAALTEAKEAEALALEAQEEASAALAKEEKAALAEAVEAVALAEESYNVAYAARQKLYVIYSHYPAYKLKLEEGSAFMVAYQDAVIKSETLPADYDEDGEEETYEEYIESLDDALELFEAEAEWLKTNMAKYEKDYRPAYVAGIEDFNDSYVSMIQTQFAYWDATIYRAYLAYYKTMLVDLTFKNENGVVVKVEDYIAGLEEQYNTISAELEEALEAYTYDYDNIYAIERLELENEQLEKCIAIWEVELEKYEAIIAAWLAQNAA